MPVLPLLLFVSAPVDGGAAVLPAVQHTLPDGASLTGLFNRRSRPQPRAQRVSPRPQASRPTPPPVAAPELIPIPKDADRFGLVREQYVAAADAIRKTDQALENARVDETDAPELTALAAVVDDAAFRKRVMERLPTLPPAIDREIRETFDGVAIGPLFDQVVAHAALGYEVSERLVYGEFDRQASVVVSYTEGGYIHTYLQAVLHRNAAGEMRIVDLIDHQTGSAASETTAGKIALHIAGKYEPSAFPTQAVRDRLFNVAHEQFLLDGRREGEFESQEEFEEELAVLSEPFQTSPRMLAARFRFAADARQLDQMLELVEADRSTLRARTTIDLNMLYLGTRFGLYEAVDAAAARLAKTMPNDAHLDSVVAATRLLIGDEQEAAAALDASLDKWSGRSLTYVQWIETCLQLGRDEQALVALRRFDATGELHVDDLPYIDGYDRFLTTTFGRTWVSELGDRFDGTQIARPAEDRVRL